MSEEALGGGGDPIEKVVVGGGPIEKVGVGGGRSHWKGGGGGWGGGGLYLMLHCHHQNDFCLKTGNVLRASLVFH